VVAVPEEYRFLSRLLEELIHDLGAQYDRIPKFFDDATWVGYRLAEVLPIAAHTKQSLLELTDARQRLELLQPHLGQVESALS
jgi:Lon protease-like protein